MREIVDLVISEIKGGWRFRWLAMAAAWLVCLGGWTYVFLMTDTYESGATILFDTTSELGELLDDLTVNADVLSRVERVRTAMLGRPQLEKVARATDMHLRASTDKEMDELVEGLRSRIVITSGKKRDANLYQILYRDPEPEMAYSVVADLLNTFVEDTLGADREDSQRAQNFLRQELADLETQLTDAEKRLADFKQANVGRMPSEIGDYFARLEKEIAALETTQSELRQAERRKDALRKQLAGERGSADVGGPQTEIDRRILTTQNRLEELRLRFTDLHPDVIALQATLEQLRQQKQQQVDAMANSDGMRIASDNPVFQNIQIELGKINVDLASIQEKEATHRRKIAELRGLVNVLPKIEAELKRLNRDYGVTQSQYRSLLQRLEVAELSESAEQSEDVKFQVIDPPLEPLKPVAPNRPVLVSLILVIAIAAGGGVAFVGNQLSPVFADPKTLRQITGLPVLGTILVMDTSARRQQRRVQVSAFSTVSVALCVVFVFVLIFHDPASQLLRSIL